MKIGGYRGRLAWVGLACLGALAVAIFASGCGKSASASGQGAPPPPAPVTVSLPLDREVLEWDEFPGRLESTQMVELRARVSGYIQSVHFREGGIVHHDDKDPAKSDLLFTIDPRPFQAELDRTLGEVDRAKAQLALAQTEFKRTQKLVPTAAASELELDQRKAQLSGAQAALAVAEANVKMAQLNVEFTQVRAPITGRISRMYINPGNLVSGGQGDSTLLTTITSLDPMYCYVDADERSVLKYQQLVREKKRPDVRSEDQRVPARLSLLNERNFAHVGYIDFVNNRIDPSTGTLQARGVFPNPGGVMTPGMYGRLRVPGSEPYRTLLVPELAVQSDQNSKYVLTVDAENTVRITPVTTGTQFGLFRAISKGLKGDERVIVNGLLKARPGLKVNPQLVPMPGADELSAALSTTRSVETGTNAPPATQPTTVPVAGPTTAPVAAVGEGSR